MSFLKKHTVKEISPYESSLFLAKIKQEEAITERIRTSSEVWMEEYMMLLTPKG